MNLTLLIVSDFRSSCSEEEKNISKKIVLIPKENAFCLGPLYGSFLPHGTSLGLEQYRIGVN